MRKHLLPTLVAICWSALSWAGNSMPDQAAAQSILQNLPLSFEQNRGQLDPQVRFLSRGSGYSLFLTPSESVLVLQKNEAGSASAKSSVVRLRFGAGEGSQPAGADPLPGKSNYLIGNDPSQWRTGVPNYGKVRYSNVRPGIDMVFYGTGRKLEYDYVVSPGADAGAIHMDVDGARKIALRKNGDLALMTSAGEVTLVKPAIYQIADGKRLAVDGRYELLGKSRIGFRLGRYDRSRELIVDPVLSYSTFLGGAGTDSARSVALDTNGAMWVAGYTESPSFPTAGAPYQSTLIGTGSRDAFVARISADGKTLEVSTFLGGNGNDQANSIAVDRVAVYIGGQTESSNFPITIASRQVLYAGLGDGFITKMTLDGSSLVYSTFLGSSEQDQVAAIAVDSAGQVYATGRTDSDSFPVSVGAYQATSQGSPDAFVSVLNSAGNGFVYSTFLGGEAGDQGTAIAVDSTFNVYVAGVTSSFGYPILNSYQNGWRGTTDAFITKLSSAGTPMFSTYLGGLGGEQATAIAVDAATNVYVTGITASDDFPLTSGAYQATRKGSFANAFITKFNPTGNTAAFSTYFGGPNGTVANAIAVNSTTGDIFVAGSAGAGLATLNPFQTAPGGSTQNAFIAKFNSTGALNYSTYLGGNGNDQALGLTLDASNNAYVVGSTASSNFPTTPITYQGKFQGGATDGFLVKIADIIGQPNPVPTITSISPNTASAGSAGVSLAVIGTNFSATSAVYWNGSPRTTQLNSPTQLTATIPAGDIATTGTVQVTVVNPAPGGGTSNSMTFTITNPAPPNPTILPNGIVNGASFAARRPVSAGSIVTAFGTNMFSAGANTIVSVNGINAPVFAATAGQVNFQMPVELAGQSTANVTVTVGNIAGSPTPVSLTTYAPGIFLAGVANSLQGAALISNSGTVPAPVGTVQGSRPANRGEFITVYATGLGPVSNQPSTGIRAGSGAQLSTTTSPVTATIGGLPATVAFAGLSPGFFGLYQIDMQVPSGLAASDAVPVVINIGGVASNVVTIAVQ